MAFDDPFAFSAVDADGRHGDVSAVDQRRRAGNADEPAPGACAAEGTEAGFLEVERKTIAARAAPAVDEHGFGPRVGEFGRLLVVTVADRPVVDGFATEQLDKPVGHLAPAIEAFVDDEPGFGILGAVLA